MPRGQFSANWTPEMRAKISASRQGVGHPRSEETRKKIGAGARRTRQNERMECSYGCGMTSNNGAIARHVAREHEFTCAVSECTDTMHKGRGLCYRHHGIDVVARTHGLNVFQYIERFHAQNGKCKICDRALKLRGEPNATRAEIVVMDHCHATGVFRGLICQSCNLVLGKVNDDINVLDRMIDYLREAQ